jgi:hypothetical protein
MSQLQDFLKQIKDNVQTDVKVYVPSKGVETEFKQITVPQQKSVIKNTLDGVTGNLQLPSVFNRIIIENCIDKSDVLITDRNAIMTQLRIASIGAELVDDDGNMTTLSLDKIIARATEKLNTTTNVVFEGIDVNLQVPNLVKDQKFFKLIAEKVMGSAGDIVNELYVHEAAKFITTISYNGIVIEPEPKDAVRLIDELPLKLNSQILNFVKTVKKYDNDFLIADNGSQITLNARFFNTPD